MNTIDDIFTLPPANLDSQWGDVDALIARLPTINQQANVWERILQHLQSQPMSKGMPYFRLGVLRLLTESDWSKGIHYLELAYKEDQRYADTTPQPAHRRGAYRLLCLVKGFLNYLNTKKNWETEQLSDPHRTVLIKTLLTVYDKSLIHVLDMPSPTYRHFSQLIPQPELSRFATENYFCAKELLELFFLEGQHINKHANEYPLARAIVGLLGGVLEALLAVRLPSTTSKTLGRLIEEAEKKGPIQVGTKLGSLASLMLYLRNHVHPDREMRQKDFFIDINVAKGCRVALDLVISEMIAE